MSHISRTTLAALAAVALTVAPMSAPAHPASQDIHVATTGSDRAAGTAAQPLRTVQAAIDRAVPGSTIKLHRGTYDGQVRIQKSGRSGAPITLTHAGDGTARLTSSQTPVSCASSQPATSRTVMVMGGADHWRIQGLTIDNGLTIAGKGSQSAFTWHKNLVNKQQVLPRRAAPGRGSLSPSDADRIVPYLRTQTGQSNLDAAEHIDILDNTITGRGIHATFARKGSVIGNNITDIDCGTGPGVWLITYADKWRVINNTVSRVAPSTYRHYMQEGIRIGSASNYNVIERNVVHSLQGDGWGINTDVDSSYNEIRNNSVNNVAIGYSDQMSGWGNRWVGNEVRNYRSYGYSLRLMDASLPAPSRHSSAWSPVLECNYAGQPVNGARALGVGGVADATFTDNYFRDAWISKNARSYWRAQSSTWDGKPTPPPARGIVPSPGARACTDG